MSDTETKVSKIILRNDTAENLQRSTEVLALAEPCFDTTNRILKIGDGVNLWNDLEVFGMHKAASVKTGTFYGNGENFISINIGKTPLKKMFISIDTSGVISTPRGTVLSMLYDAATGEKAITYQGYDAHYVGTHSGSQLTANYSKNGDNYIYTFGYRSSNDPTYYDKFANGCKYTYMAALDDVAEAPVSSSDFTQQASGEYIAPSSDTLLSNDIVIDIGFKPKVFAMFIQGGTQQDNNTNYKITTTFFVANDGGNIIYAGTNFAYKVSSSNSNCNTGYTESTKNYFYPSDNGVFAGNADNVYLKANGKYKWLAVR